MNDNLKPIFIVGCSKSGTTLLRNLFDGHPELFVVPIETHFFQLSKMWVNYYSRRTKPQSIKIDHIKENIINWVRFQNSKDNFLADGFTKGKWDIELFSQEMRSRNADDLPELFNLYFASLYVSLYKKNYDNKLRVVEKSVENAEFVWELASYYPDAYFIHIIRNPYANLVALRKYVTSKKSSKLKNALFSMYSSNYYLYKNKALVKKYHIIKYEDLVSKPDIMIKNICDFAGITFSEILSKPSVLGNNWPGNSTSNNKFDKISKAPISSWQNEITKQEIYYMNTLFDFIFRDFDYIMLDEKSDIYKNAKNDNLITRLKNIIQWNSFPTFNDK